jgi:pimeloyl-ACP methyl ester carboxylesterase
MFPGGPGFSGDYMRPDAELFADELQSFVIDLHGSGESKPTSSPEGYTPTGHARFYEEVRLALDLDRVVVFGHSFGATTGLTYCALSPRRRLNACRPQEVGSAQNSTRSLPRRPGSRWKPP